MVTEIESNIQLERSPQANHGWWPAMQLAGLTEGGTLIIAKQLISGWSMNQRAVSCCCLVIMLSQQSEQSGALACVCNDVLATGAMRARTMFLAVARIRFYLHTDLTYILIFPYPLFPITMHNLLVLLTSVAHLEWWCARHYRSCLCHQKSKRLAICHLSYLDNRNGLGSRITVPVIETYQCLKDFLDR